MTKQYRVYYEEGLNRYGFCGNERKLYIDEIPILVTQSLTVAEEVWKKLNER